MPSQSFHLLLLLLRKKNRMASNSSWENIFPQKTKRFSFFYELLKLLTSLVPSI